MVKLLTIGAIVLLLCIISIKLLYKFGVPALLIFIVLGMVFGTDGLVGIEFSDYNLTSKICSFGLIFIIFYGGFSTKWSVAKPIVVPSILLSTLGVVITAFLTGFFCTFALGMTMLEGLLIGAVVSSTDAASVFAILRSKKLNLKSGIASMLEIESGSNDPFAYMLTMIISELMISGSSSLGFTIKLIFSQIIFALMVGYVLIKFAGLVLKNVNLHINGLYPIFVISIAILAYSLCELIGGNGYLCTYIVGIGLGNSKILHKTSLVQFFDGISWLMQILLFFTLGLLSFPSYLPSLAGSAIALLIFMIFVARPVAVFAILSWFKVGFKEKVFVSWVGLRGAASIVFAIYALTSDVTVVHDIFHLVFFLALFSVTVQGTLIPIIAKKLDLIQDEELVLKTFTDYKEETITELVEYQIGDNNRIAGKSIVDANIPEEILIVMIKRANNVIVPKGSTVLNKGDTLVLSSNNIENLKNIDL